MIFKYRRMLMIRFIYCRFDFYQKKIPFYNSQIIFFIQILIINKSELLINSKITRDMRINYWNSSAICISWNNIVSDIKCQADQYLYYSLYRAGRKINLRLKCYYYSLEDRNYTVNTSNPCANFNPPAC